MSSPGVNDLLPRCQGSAAAASPLDMSHPEAGLPECAAAALPAAASSRPTPYEAPGCCGSAACCLRQHLSGQSSSVNNFDDYLKDEELRISGKGCGENQNAPAVAVEQTTVRPAQLGRHPLDCGCYSCAERRAVNYRLGYDPMPAKDWRGVPFPRPDL